MQIRRIAFDSGLERDLYFLSVTKPDSFPESISIGSPAFSVFIAMDATGLDAAIITKIFRPLMRAGAVYFSCFGPDCERVHDIIDEELVSTAVELSDDRSVIMTTWHSYETLEDALEFFVRNSIPADNYLDACQAGLAICFGNPTWDDQIVDGLKKLTKENFSD